MINEVLGSMSGTGSKVMNFFIKNKKIIKFFFFLIFGLFFVVGFSLYLFSGIGVAAGNDIELQPPYPSHNGVWYVDDYINTNTALNGQYFNSWESLKNAFETHGQINAHNYFSMAYTLYTMYNVTLPIWIVGFVFLALYFIFKLLTKLAKKLLMKKMGKAFGLQNNSKGSSKNEEIDLSGIDLDLGNMNQDIMDIINKVQNSSFTTNTNNDKANDQEVKVTEVTEIIDEDDKK